MLCAKRGKKIDEGIIFELQKKSGRIILLIGIICCLVLTGCGSKDGSVSGSAVNGSKQAEESRAIDDEKAVLEAELAETKAELAKAQEALTESDVDYSETVEDEEEPVRLEVDKVSEEELKQAEYLRNLQVTVDNWMYNRKSYKFTFYADDINKDGFPEVIMLGDKNTGRGVEQELSFIFLFYQEHWNEETRRMEQLAINSNNLASVFYSNTDTVPESGVLEFSYSADGRNIVSHIYSSRDYSSSENSMFRNATYVIKDEVCLYKDNEVIHNGNRTKGYFESEYQDPEFGYLTFDAQYGTWTDEESYDDLPIPECDKTVRFTARCGWKTVDEALEHMGELPQ